MLIDSILYLSDEKNHNIRALRQPHKSLILNCTMQEKIVNGTMVASGSLFLLLGIIGIFMPILPTTPFLLLTAACYARGSKRFYNWLINNRLLGQYIKNYREGRGLPLNAKVITIMLLWFTISFSIIFFIDNYLIQIVLLIIAILVTIHIILIRTAERRLGD